MPTLYLIPCTLGDNPPHEVIPEKTIEIIKKLDHFIVEEEKTARRFLIKIGIEKSIDSVNFYILNEHTERKHIELFFYQKNNYDFGLLSEAGVPAIADPGSELVLAAHKAGYRIIPLTGPSSILLAMMASGLNGQNFAFNGYLPVKDHERKIRLQHLEKRSLLENQSQIFIETPYRNNQLLKTIIESCSSETLLCIATNLTLQSERICTKTIADWKKEMPDLHKQPAIFILHKH
jgi:16S rRNA (cytidine1402-2'-O)-methyltransferase